MRLAAVPRISAMRNRIRREVSQSVIVCKDSLLKFDNRRIPLEVSQSAPVCKESLAKCIKMRLAAVPRISAMRNRIRREVSQSVIACKDSRLKFDNRRIPREVSQSAPL